MPEGAVLRKRLVRLLSERGAIASEAVRDAFSTVPREIFVPEAAATRGLDAVYADEVFVTKTDSLGQAISSSSQPGIMGPMLEQLELEPGHRVLEVGAGTGYNAALLKAIVGARGRVTSLELDSDTARRARAALRNGGFSVRVVHADGREGWPEGAPYDRIIVTASSAEVPRAWFDQLAPGGLVQFPVRLRTDNFGPQIVVTFVRDRNALRSVRRVPGGFMAMRQADGADCPDTDRIAMHIRSGGRDATVALSGRAIGRMSDLARRRLAAVLAERPRRRVLYRGAHDRAGGALLYVALAVRPQHLADAGGWWGVAVFDPEGTSAAALARSATNLTSQAWGAAVGAERELLGLVEGWRSAGRPSWRDLYITTTFGSRPVGAWRTSRRGEGFLAFDWVPGSEPGSVPRGC